MKKKLLLAGTAVVIVSSTVLAYNRDSMTVQPTPKPKTQTALSSTETTAPTASTAPQESSTLSTTTPTPPTTTTSTTTAPPTYGEDPNNPGVYVVFDKSTALSDAGISDQDAATLIAKINSGWVYKSGSLSQNLCNVTPPQKMATAGADYLDNPITQLKWCNSYVTSTYGAWGEALKQFLKNGSF